MKTIITKGGQYFETWESRKEALKDVVENIMYIGTVIAPFTSATRMERASTLTIAVTARASLRKPESHLSFSATLAPLRFTANTKSTTLMMLTKSTARKTTAKKKSGTSHKLSNNLQSDRRKAGNETAWSQARAER